MSIPGSTFTQSIIYTENVKKQGQKSDEELWSLVDSAFAEFDKNNTGELDSSQLKKFLQYAVKIKLIQPSKRNLFIDYIFKIDTNKDGLISKQELYQFFQTKNNKGVQYGNTPNQNAKQGEKIKTVTPKPANGRASLNMGKKWSQQQLRDHVSQAFSKYDDNKTGQLDYYEMRNYLKCQWNNAFNYHEIVKQADGKGQSNTRANGLISSDQLYYFLKHKLI